MPWTSYAIKEQAKLGVKEALTRKQLCRRIWFLRPPHPLIEAECSPSAPFVSCALVAASIHVGGRPPLAPTLSTEVAIQFIHRFTGLHLPEIHKVICAFDHDRSTLAECAEAALSEMEGISVQ